MRLSWRSATAAISSIDCEGRMTPSKSGTSKVYTCGQIRRLADETRALPADSMLAVVMNDFRLLQIQL